MSTWILPDIGLSDWCIFRRLQSTYYWPLYINQRSETTEMRSLSETHSYELVDSKNKL